MMGCLTHEERGVIVQLVESRAIAVPHMSIKGEP